MATAPIAALERRVLTDVVNRREKGKRALTNLLFPRSQERIMTTKSIQIDELTGGHGMAPYVERNGKALVVGQHNGRSYSVEAPSINIKRPITCSDELLLRAAGQNVLVANGVDVYAQALQAQIAADLIFMDDEIEDRNEWFVAQLLQGEVEYSVASGASFSLDSRKPAGNDIIAADLWDGSAPKPFRDILRAKRVVQPYSAPPFSHAICGQDAANAVVKMLEAGTITSIKTDSGIRAGMGDLTSNYDVDGMLYLGTFSGIPFYEYAGLDGDGNALIRTDHVEFVSVARPENRPFFYTPIADVAAVKAGMHLSRRYVASDIDVDRGTYVAYMKSNPLPWFLRADHQVSLQVV